MDIKQNIFTQVVRIYTIIENIFSQMNDQMGSQLKNELRRKIGDDLFLKIKHFSDVKINIPPM